MKNVCLYYVLLFVFCYAVDIRSEGFVSNTLVYTLQGRVPIQELVIDDQVLAYNFNNSVASERIANVVCHEVGAIVQLRVEGDTIELTQDQLLFVPLQNKWLPASLIQPGMYLLGAPLNAIEILSVTHSKQRRLVYALSLDKNHTYLVGKYSIVVHNFTGATLAVAGAAEGLTFLPAFLAANPLVAPVTLGVGGVGLIVWKLIHDTRKTKRFVKRDKGKNNDSRRGQSEDPKKPRNDESYGNMYEVFKSALIGKILKEVSEPTRFHYQGAKIFKAIKDVVEYGIKKGDWFYLDNLHGDHIEVFKPCGKIMRTVLNMDGTQNFKKLAQALAEGRRITEWIN